MCSENLNFVSGYGLLWKSKQDSNLVNQASLSIFVGSGHPWLCLGIRVSADNELISQDYPRCVGELPRYLTLSTAQKKQKQKKLFILSQECIGSWEYSVNDSVYIKIRWVTSIYIQVCRTPRKTYINGIGNPAVHSSVVREYIRVYDFLGFLVLQMGRRERKRRRGSNSRRTWWTQLEIATNSGGNTTTPSPPPPPQTAMVWIRIRHQRRRERESEKSEECRQTGLPCIMGFVGTVWSIIG